MSLAASISLIICTLMGNGHNIVVYRGYAAHYDYGVMERVAVNREMVQADCMVASPFEDLGTWVKVQSLVTGHIETCRVTDIAAPKDRDRIIAKGIVLEFGHAQIGSMCALEYTSQEPPRKCPVVIQVLN